MTEHLVLGVAGVVLARTSATARGYLLAGGVLYAALVVFGAVVDEATTASFVPVNTADDWLHLGLAVLMLLAGGLAPGPDNGVAFVGPRAGDRGAHGR